MPGLEHLPIETTIYSMSSAPPSKDDRRSGERHLTLFRVGSIRLDGRRELCLVKNISAGGALVRAYCQLGTGFEVQLELKEQQAIAGRICWVRGTDVGIEFNDPVDVIDLLKSSDEGPRPRMPRVEVRCIAFIREGAASNRATVSNVSQGGLSVECENPLTVGSDVIVSLPGLPPRGGLVRWAEGNRYGISFNAILPLAGLVEWLHGRESN